MSPTLTRLRAEKYKKSYYDFFVDTWPLIEPRPLVNNWHIKYLCDRLQQEAERIAQGFPRIKHLVVNVPPRSLKSSIFTISFPSWVWTLAPWTQFINVSYAEALATKHNVKSRDLMRTKWYSKHFGDQFSFKGDQDTKTHYDNDRMGFRRAVGIDGSITGDGGDIVIIDDPINPKKASSMVEIENSVNAFKDTISTRLNDPDVGMFIIVMQRLNEDDLTGFLQKELADDFEFIVIPGEIENYDCTPGLEKHYQDGLFFPQRFTWKTLNNFKRLLGSMQFAGQIGQSPSPAEGNIIPVQKINYYTKFPDLATFDELVISGDLTFKGEKQSKNVEGLAYTNFDLWGNKGADCYLLDQIRGRWGYTEMKTQFKNFCQKWPSADRKMIEDKANGPALQDELQSEIPGLIMVTVEGSKEERVHLVVPLYDGNNVYLPSPEIFPEVTEIVREYKNFPRAKLKDRVDTMSQALDRWRPIKGDDDPFVA